MAFRSQEFHELCSACKAKAKSACPRCGVALCPVHAHDPYGCCERCATDIFRAVNGAGYRQMTWGGIVSVASAAILYFLGPLITPAVTGLLLLGMGGGLGCVLWGGIASPRLTDRRMRGQLTRPRELAAPRPPVTDPDAGDDEL